MAPLCITSEKLEQPAKISGFAPKGRPSLSQTFTRIGRNTDHTFFYAVFFLIRVKFRLRFIQIRSSDFGQTDARL